MNPSNLRKKDQKPSGVTGRLLAFLAICFGAFKASFVLLKLGKLGATGGSMILSLVIYSQIWGWKFAAGFLVLMLIHEIGHSLAAWQRGIGSSAPVFIPFVGAYIQTTDTIKDAETEAYVALGGPILGTVGSIAAYGLSLWYDSTLLLAVAYSGFFLNLINLLPVSPLDGGRITAVVSPKIWLIGAPMMLAFMLYRPSPGFLLLAILAIPQLIAAWKYDPTTPENRVYYAVPRETKITYGLLYLGLAAGLALMSYEVHAMLEHLRPGRP